MDEIIEILRETPWWVYLIFAYLCILGWQASRPRKIPFKRLYILPLLLTVWSIYGLYDKLQGRYGLVVAWLAAIGIGIAIGWVCVRSWKVVLDRKQGTIELPGTWSTLILVLLIFIARYFFGYTYAVNPDAFNNTTFFLIDVSISGLITGMFFGRLFCFMRK